MQQTGIGEFGEYFRTLRKRCGLSQAKLGEKAGIAVRTLAYWEAGEREPRVDELTHAFEAMEVSTADKACVLALLRSVRGAQFASQQAVCQQIAPSLGHLPNLGDLVRAMRMRKGWSREQLAAELGINHSTLVRWEAMQTLPSDTNLQRLCAVLDAEVEEAHVLCNRRLLPDSAPVLTLAMAEERTAAFERDILAANCPMVDLQALVLKRQLRLLIPQSSRALCLLARVEAVHSRWLIFHDRTVEAEAVAMRALAIVHPELPQETFWHTAINVISLCLSGREGERSLTALRYLRRWFDQISDPALVALVSMDMATYAARANQQGVAQQLLRQARTHIPSDQEHSLNDYYRVTQAQVLIAGDQAEEAIDLLLPLPACGDRLIFLQYLLVKALHRSGTDQDTHHYLNQLLHETANYTGNGIKRRIETLTGQINGAHNASIL